jgi:hypothetical protein
MTASVMARRCMIARPIIFGKRLKRRIHGRILLQVGWFSVASANITRATSPPVLLLTCAEPGKKSPERGYSPGIDKETRSGSRKAGRQLARWLPREYLTPRSNRRTCKCYVRIIHARTFRFHGTSGLLLDRRSRQQEEARLKPERQRERRNWNTHTRSVE